MTKHINIFDEKILFIPDFKLDFFGFELNKTHYTQLLYIMVSFFGKKIYNIDRYGIYNHPELKSIIEKLETLYSILKSIHNYSYNYIKNNYTDIYNQLKSIYYNENMEEYIRGHLEYIDKNNLNENNVYTLSLGFNSTYFRLNEYIMNHTIYNDIFTNTIDLLSLLFMHNINSSKNISIFNCFENNADFMLLQYTIISLGVDLKINKVK